jgi:hypothetical protein
VDSVRLFYKKLLTLQGLLVTKLDTAWTMLNYEADIAELFQFVLWPELVVGNKVRLAYASSVLDSTQEMLGRISQMHLSK